MRTKKLAVILISVVFAIVVLASSIAMFSVKKINVSYAVGDETETSAVQENVQYQIRKTQHSFPVRQSSGTIERKNKRV